MERGEVLGIVAIWLFLVFFLLNLWSREMVIDGRCFYCLVLCSVCSISVLTSLLGLGVEGDGERFAGFVISSTNLYIFITATALPVYFLDIYRVSVSRHQCFPVK